MYRILAAAALLLATPSWSQTPTPIQPKKNIPTTTLPTPMPPATLPTPVLPTTTSTSNVIKIPPIYCANSFSVYKGVLTFDRVYSVELNHPRCFTDGVETYIIKRVVIVPKSTNYTVEQKIGQRVRLMIIEFKMVSIVDQFELVAIDYLMMEDS